MWGQLNFCRFTQFVVQTWKLWFDKSIAKCIQKSHIHWSKSSKRGHFIWWVRTPTVDLDNRGFSLQHVFTLLGQASMFGTSRFFLKWFQITMMKSWFQQKVYSLYISMFKNNMLTGFFWEGLVVCASMAKLLLSASQAPFSPSLCYKDGEELLRVPVRGHRPKNTDKSCNTALLVDWALLGGFSQDRCKWLISMLSFRPLTGVVGPLPKGLNGSQMLNYLLIGMILEVELCHLLLPFPSLKLAPEIWWERNTFSCLFGAKRPIFRCVCC